MNSITVDIPPAFVPTLDELVNQAQVSSREEWLKNVLKRIIFDYQMSKDFAPQQQQRLMQLNAFWP